MPFLVTLGDCPASSPAHFEHAIHAGRAAGGHVGVDHHEGQPAIAFQRIAPREATDALFFVVGEPVVAGHPSVVLVDLAETGLPVVELARADADPGEHAGRGNSHFSDQERTKSTTSSRVSCGTQRPVRVPQVLFLKGHAPP